MTVRILEPDDAQAVITLRREALTTAPLAFGSSPDDDRRLDLEVMRSTLGARDGAVVFGAFEGERLIGMAGLVRMERLKSRHRALI